MKTFNLISVIITSIFILTLMGCKESLSPPYSKGKASLQNLKADSQAPIADAGPDQTLTDSDGNGFETVTLDGRRSYDPDGNIISYSWTKDGNIGLGPLSPVIAADFKVGVHTVILYVTDNDGFVGEDTTIITILEQNPLKPPTGVKAVFDEETDAARVCWRASPTPNVSYAVYRSFRSGGPYRKIATGVKKTCYLDLSASDVEGNLYYVVTSIDETGKESEFSNEAVLILD